MIVKPYWTDLAIRSDAISKHNKKWVANSLVVLTCNTNARPSADSYKFYLNGKLKTVSTSGVYRVKNLKRDDCGEYKCIPANEMGEGDAGYGNIDIRGIADVMAAIMVYS